jgi:hypothetical protein
MPSLAELMKELTPRQNQYMARLVASLPKSEGGLGFSLENTALERAKALGYDIENPVYHGTEYDFPEISTEGKGKTSGAGAFVTNNPLVAETYVPGSGAANIIPLLMKREGLMEVNAKGRNWNDINTNDLSYKRKRLTNLFEDLSPNDVTTTDELAMLASDAGHKGITIKNVKDLGPNSHVFRAKEYIKQKYGIDVNPEWSNVSGNQFAEARDAMKKMYESQKSDVTALNDPAMVRSRFAGFNPWRKKEANLLASHPIANAVGLTGLGKLLSQGQNTDLRGSINDYLSEGYDPAGLERLTGVAPTTRKGDIALEAFGAMPGPIGTMATGANLVDMAENADWKKIKKSISNYFR